MVRPDRATFRDLAGRARMIAIYRRIFSDQLTPVLAYRRLVAPDEREAPSFLLESVEGGARQGRYSFLGARPRYEIVARERHVEVIDHQTGRRSVCAEDDPLLAARRMSADWRPIAPKGLPASFTGGWVGYAAYDAVRFAEPDKLPFARAPRDDRELPDLAFGFYPQVAVFDHVQKILFAVQWVEINEHDESIDTAYDRGVEGLNEFITRLQTHSVPLPAGSVEMSLRERSAAPGVSNMSWQDFESAVLRAKDYIMAGDVLQVVLSQRFERETTADPFEIYRALRIVNPSPYMIYLQAPGSILVASSPEILCRVSGRTVVNRPLAGTRRRGASPEEDAALERELLADDKERAEHIMLVDLGRNDVGRVAQPGSVTIERMMEIERYSHVMHISSTITGRLRDGLDCWDALRAALPVGTISGAPKVRAMQIIDELEPARRGPYGGGIGAVSLLGDMDIALALRTMVIPIKFAPDSASAPGAALAPGAARRSSVDRSRGAAGPGVVQTATATAAAPRRWTVHLQAGAGVVADSIPSNEFDETVNKAAALNRAIDLAERAFRQDEPGDERERP